MQYVATASRSCHWRSAGREAGLGANSLGQTPSVYLTGALIIGSFVIYQVSRPGPNGELSAVHKYFEKLSNYGTEWETKNHLMTAALEQAAHDRHLLYGVERSKYHELKFPEYVIISYNGFDDWKGGRVR